MNNAEKRALTDRVRAMTPEEQEFITRFLPSEYLSKELERRCTTAGAMLYEIDKVANDISNNPSLEEMQVAIRKVKFILK
jgi:hypothetical protein